MHRSPSTCRWQVLLTLAALLFGQAASAGVKVAVNTTVDEFGGGAACSLREALYTINHATNFGGCVRSGATLFDQVNVPAGVYAITRAPQANNLEAGGSWYVTADIAIVGAGPDKSILDGGAIDRVLRIEPGSMHSVSVSGLALRNGSPVPGDPQGAGLEARFSGTLSVSNVLIENNTAASAVFLQDVAATLSNVTVRHNFAAGFYLYGTAASEFDNVTISGNSADVVDGAMFVMATTGALTLNNTTIAYNTGAARGSADPALDVGGIYIAAGNVVNVRNSIIARNSVGSRVAGGDCRGSINSQGYNLIEDTTHCVIGGVQVGNLTGLDPKLAPLFDYGSGLPTHLLLPGSPALDSGNPAAPGSGGNSCLAADARGLARNKSRCDMGAYEYRADFIVDTTLDQVDANSNDGLCQSGSGFCSLRAAVQQANAAASFRTIYVPAGNYQLTIPSSHQQGDDTTGSLKLNGAYAVTLLGAGSDKTIITQTDAQESTVQAAQVSGTTPVSLHALTARAGDATLYSGAAMLIDRVRVTQSTNNPGIYLPDADSNASLLMVDSTVDHNSGQSSGGLYVGSRASASILNSTFAYNTALGSGGAIFSNGGSVALAFSTIARNTARVAFAGNGGGGIARGNSASYRIVSSILSDNLDLSGQGNDCAATVQFENSNLLRDPTGCTLGGTPPLTNADPALTPLLDQPGAPPTLALLPRSAVHGYMLTPQDCIDADGGEVLADERGSARYVGPSYGADAASTCDLGAYQGSNGDVIFADDFQ